MRPKEFADLVRWLEQSREVDVDLEKTYAQDGAVSGIVIHLKGLGYFETFNFTSEES